MVSFFEIPQVYNIHYKITKILRNNYRNDVINYQETPDERRRAS